MNGALSGLMEDEELSCLVFRDADCGQGCSRLREESVWVPWPPEPALAGSPPLQRPPHTGSMSSFCSRS